MIVKKLVSKSDSYVIRCNERELSFILHGLNGYCPSNGVTLESLHNMIHSICLAKS